MRIFLLCCASTTIAHAQTRPDIVRGRVTSDSGVAIRGAMIAATMAPDRFTQQTTTDSAGRYSLRFAMGTGDYLVYASAPGYKPFRQRITRVAAETTLVVDVRLSPIVTQLASVNVTAAKLVPQRDDRSANDVGAPDQARDGVLASLPVEHEGVLAAIANIIPGASAQTEGLSIFGLNGSQSSTTLNGMAFGGTSLPRDGARSISVATSPYDPARGGFSGAQTNVELAPGGTYRRQGTRLTLDAPLLQTTDALGDRFGVRYASIDGSYLSSGAIHDDQYYYSHAIELTRRQSDAPSLLSVGSDALIAAGLSPDSAARLQSLLAAAHVPTNGAGIPGSAISQRLSFSTRFDRAPYFPGTRKIDPSSWNVVLVGNVDEQQALSASPLSIATWSGSRIGLALTAQGTWSRYFGDVLNEARTAYSIDDARGTPYLRLPGGRVLISSILPDGVSTAASADFGGNSTLDYRRRSWTWEAINETQWYAKGSPHRVKLTLESRLDGYTQSTPDDLLGTFTFPSLDAIAVGQPSSFSRALVSPSRNGGEWSGVAALGDYWRVTRSLQFLYGARLEGNHYTTTLLENPAVTSLFGESTRSAPNTIHISPRAGFSWYFGRPAGFRSMSFSRIASQTLGPVMVLRGGIGEFRNLLSPSLLAGANATNGLPGSTERLVCLGAAAPVPQWSSYLDDTSSIPSACANGAPSAFSDQAPAIRLFDRNYDASRSWRANLTFQRFAGPFALSLDGVYSLNLNQPSTVDVNFTGTPRFILTEEGRPVFVSPASIVPGTGVVSPVESRVSGAYGRVVRMQSDLRSTSRQLSLTIKPGTLRNWVYGLTYTLGDMQADTRGFDGSTFTSPATLERIAGNLDIRHQVMASFGAPLPYGMNIGLFARFMSGAPYTPLVNGDANGDGLSNDRAFIFDPDRTVNPAVAASMRTLLATAPTQARDCLRQQLGVGAAANSCRGPWTAFMNARVGLKSVGGWTRRSMYLSANISNPLTGLDLLFHGADHVQGWGGGTTPDPVLLIVRGFDPASNRFAYDVNQRFGSTRSSQQVTRAPFRLTLDVTMDLGIPTAKQQALRLLSPGRNGHPGPRTSVDSIRAKLARQVTDVYEDVLDFSDSLLISRDQSEALKAARIVYRAKMDAHWKARSEALAATDDDFDANRAMHMVNDAVEDGWMLTVAEIPTLERILTPIQMQLGPSLLARLKAAVGKKTYGWRTGASF